MEHPFYGTGWSFPPTFSRELSGLVMASGRTDIEQSLRILMGTLPGERSMLPAYGIGVADLVFETMDTTTQTEFLDRVRTAILRFEPRVEVLRLNLDTTELASGLLSLEVDYRPRSTNTRFNFVYPFYRNEGSQIDLP
ncbi:GPW/gp25 family protein [Neolewinella antarctica]|uniref:IraD/Gp25-like domain-containing protein n=1 Tax=Neolewinella antarctica TaxID=442734 RepID=A0ABX0X6P3_9BACT|nr:GPW/gp25 family protein [Neolewinella antarctica]NJC24666.1 hypothetical protein [Neolewinella antarctica]